MNKLIYQDQFSFKTQMELHHPTLVVPQVPTPKLKKRRRISRKSLIG